MPVPLGRRRRCGAKEAAFVQQAAGLLQPYLSVRAMEHGGVSRRHGQAAWLLQPGLPASPTAAVYVGTSISCPAWCGRCKKRSVSTTKEKCDLGMHMVYTHESGSE